MTLTEAQRLLLGIIASVEAGVTTPEEAVKELSTLKNKAAKSGLNFRANYTLDDFQKIRTTYVSTYDSSGAFETSEPYVESTSY